MTLIEKIMGKIIKPILVPAFISVLSCSQATGSSAYMKNLKDAIFENYSV